MDRYHAKMNATIPWQHGEVGTEVEKQPQQGVSWQERTAETDSSQPYQCDNNIDHSPTNDVTYVRMVPDGSHVDRAANMRLESRVYLLTLEIGLQTAGISCPGPGKDATAHRPIPNVMW